LTLYKERVGIPFFGSFRFGPIEEADIELMAEAGASVFGMGVESGDEEQRRTLLRKNVTDEQVLYVTGLLRKHGIAYGCSAFFGLPGDTVEEHVKRLEFYRRVKPNYLWTTFFTPFPGLELTENKAIQDHMPAKKGFPLTFHHDMYLDLPDKHRLVRLKKIYFLLMLWPKATRFMVWLTRFRIPLLFDLVFLCHYVWYIRTFERLSVLQLLQHVKTFTVNPILKKTRLLRC